MKQLSMTLDDNGQLSATANDISLDDASAMCFTYLMSFANMVVKHEPTAKPMIYDMFNLEASNWLAQFAPDIEMRPDITTEALLRAETELALEQPDKFKRA